MLSSPKPFVKFIADWYSLLGEDSDINKELWMSSSTKWSTIWLKRRWEGRRSYMKTRTPKRHALAFSKADPRPAMLVLALSFWLNFAPKISPSDSHSHQCQSGQQSLVRSVPGLRRRSSLLEWWEPCKLSSVLPAWEYVHVPYVRTKERERYVWMGR